MCTLLLKHGANVNSQNHQGRTPLWRAAFMDKQDCVKLLLGAGGDPRIPSSDQQTPLQVAPTAAMREILSSWDVAQTEVLLAQNLTLTLTPTLNLTLTLTLTLTCSVGRDAARVGLPARST